MSKLVDINDVVAAISAAIAKQQEWAAELEQNPGRSGPVAAEAAKNAVDWTASAIMAALSHVPAQNINTAAMAAHQMQARRAPVATRASLAAHHVLGAEPTVTPTWKLVALAAVAGVAGYMTPGLLKKLKKK